MKTSANTSIAEIPTTVILGGVETSKEVFNGTLSKATSKDNIKETVTKVKDTHGE